MSAWWLVWGSLAVLGAALALASGITALAIYGDLEAVLKALGVAGVVLAFAGVMGGTLPR